MPNPHPGKYPIGKHIDAMLKFAESGNLSGVSRDMRISFHTLLRWKTVGEWSEFIKSALTNASSQSINSGNWISESRPEAVRHIYDILGSRNFRIY